MKDVQISIRGTDVISSQYNNTFKSKPGEKMNIQVKSNVAIRLNPAAPTNAMVVVKFEAKDADNVLSFALETITAVQSSTYVEDFEELIKKEYLNVVMLAVNEKIRCISSTLGLNVSVPPIVFGPKPENNGGDDNVIDFTKN